MGQHNDKTTGDMMTDQPEQQVSEQDRAADADAEQDQAAGERADDAQETAVDAHAAEDEDDAPVAENPAQDG